MESQAKQAAQVGCKEKPLMDSQAAELTGFTVCPGTTCSDLRADLMLSWRLVWTHSQIPSKFSSTILGSLTAKTANR